jgi:hypothetical protein
MRKSRYNTIITLVLIFLSASLLYSCEQNSLYDNMTERFTSLFNGIGFGGNAIIPIIVIKGNNSPNTSIYDPEGDSFMPGPSLPSSVGTGSHHFFIPSGLQAGKRLIVHGNNSTVTSLYDPASGTFSPGPTLTCPVGDGGNWFYINSGLQAGKTMVVSGNLSLLTSLYDPVNNQFDPGPSLIGTTAGGGSINFPVTSGIHVGMQMVIHGRMTTAVSIYNPADNTCFSDTSLADAAFIGAHSFQILSGTLTGTIMVVVSFSTNITNLYYPSLNAFMSSSMSGPPDPPPVLTDFPGAGSHDFLIDSGPYVWCQLVIIGGNNPATSLYDPFTNTFVAGPNLSSAASGGSITFKISQGPQAGKFLVLHGFSTNLTTLLDPADLFSPVSGPSLNATGSVGIGALCFPMR